MMRVIVCCCLWRRVKVSAVKFGCRGETTQTPSHLGGGGLAADSLVTGLYFGRRGDLGHIAGKVGGGRGADGHGGRVGA